MGEQVLEEEINVLKRRLYIWQMFVTPKTKLKTLVKINEMQLELEHMEAMKKYYSKEIR